MKLLVGLGNPGNKHAHNRHNVGFMALDRIADRHGFSAWRKRFQGLTADGEIDGERVLLLKPQTYMNESGRSVGEAVRFLKLALGDVVVIYDEIDLAPGKLKAKTGGGNAGHNGLRSMSAHVGNDYVRIRIGVGHPGHKDRVADYVLHDFAKADAVWLEPLLDAIADASGRLAAGDAARFLTDVARTLGSEEEAKPEKKSKPETDKRAPGGGEHKAGKAGGHPAGERQAKRQSALADNLKAWLAARKPGSRDET
ncbi:MAG: aminoacyl-tRNA hydrolase [Hyphomicrobiaceae bacterium]